MEKEAEEAPFLSLWDLSSGAIGFGLFVCSKMYIQMQMYHKNGIKTQRLSIPVWPTLELGE